MSTISQPSPMQFWPTGLEDIKSFNTTPLRPNFDVPRDLSDELVSHSSPKLPPTWPPNSIHRHAPSSPTFSEPDLDRNPLPFLLNSGCRSTWELLRELPSPAIIATVLPTLPTHYYTPSELDSQLPDPIFRPLSLSMFESLHSAEAEYSRLLDLRERLRVEEILLEMKTDMERLYLFSPIYRAYQGRLGNVRVLIMKACQSLSYIEDECASHGLDLEIFSIDQRRKATRPPSHPFMMIATYLNPSAVDQFYDYDFFAPHISLDAATPGSDSQGNGQELATVTKEKIAGNEGDDEDDDEDEMDVDEDEDEDEGQGEDEAEAEAECEDEEREAARDVGRRLGKAAESVVVDQGSSTSDESLLSSHYSLFLPTYNKHHDFARKQSQDTFWDTSNNTWPGRSLDAQPDIFRP